MLGAKLKTLKRIILRWKRVGVLCWCSTRVAIVSAVAAKGNVNGLAAAISENEAVNHFVHFRESLVY